MKIAVAVLAFILAGGAAIPARAPAPPVTHAATVQIIFADSGRCSGTVVGPHAILSASHCFAEAPLVAVDGQAANMVRSITDGADHTIIWVDKTFVFWAEPGPTVMGQGQKLHWWGNPLGRKDLYREGYVSGFESPDWVLIDAMVGPGDSGSGLFNSAGQLVGVISSVFSPVPYFHVAGAKIMAFTPEQWAEAQR